MPLEIRTNILPALRIAQAILAIFVLGLDAYPIDWLNHTIYPVPSDIAFLIFCSVFTLLIHLPYSTLCPKYFPALANGYFSLGIELSTTIFWFCGFITQAVFLANLLVCRGSVCISAQAATAFATLEFCLFVITSYFPVYYVFMAEKREHRRETNENMKLARRSAGHQRLHSNWLGQKKDDTMV